MTTGPFYFLGGGLLECSLFSEIIMINITISDNLGGGLFEEPDVIPPGEETLAVPPPLTEEKERE